MKRNKLLLLLLAILLVFILQPFKVGFEKGHHGWVSSHVLAQITNAHPDNFFLGYAKKIITSDGFDYQYFDRYPVLFSAVSHTVLSPFWDNLDWYVYMSRQWMNIIFLIIGWLVFSITRKLVESREQAVAVTLFIVSSSLLIKYKDMVHFDQPALVGCLLALKGILDYEKSGSKKFLWWGALLGPLLGRGYSVIFFLFSWGLIKGIFLFKREKRISLSALKVPVLFTILSVPLPAIMLSLNILGEASIRNVPWHQTSIVESAQARLGLKHYVNEDKSAKKVPVVSFVLNQVYRAFDYGTPYVVHGIHFKDYSKKVRHYLTVIPKALFQIFILFILVKFWPSYWRNMREESKFLSAVFMSGGVLWIVVMRNLAHFHEYVSMYLIGGLIIYWIFLSDLMIRKGYNIVRIASIVFFLSLFLNFTRETVTAGQVNWQSEEFQKLRNLMKEQNFKAAYFEKEQRTFFLEGVPYGEAFFLSGFALASKPELAQVKVKLESKKLLVEKL